MIPPPAAGESKGNWAAKAQERVARNAMEQAQRRGEEPAARF